MFFFSSWFIYSEHTHTHREGERKRHRIYLHLEHPTYLGLTVAAGRNTIRQTFRALDNWHRIISFSLAAARNYRKLWGETRTIRALSGYDYSQSRDSQQKLFSSVNLPLSSSFYFMCSLSVDEVHAGGNSRATVESYIINQRLRKLKARRKVLPTRQGKHTRFVHAAFPYSAASRESLFDTSPRLQSSLPGDTAFCRSRFLAFFQ